MDESQPSGSPPDWPSTSQSQAGAVPSTPATPPPGPPGEASAVPQSEPPYAVPPGPEPAIGWVDPTTRRGPNVLVLIGLVVLLVVVAVVGALIWVGAHVTPFDRAMATATARLITDPTFTSKYGNLKGDDAFRVGGQLVADGIRRTDAKTQLTFAQSLNKLLNVADKPTCAGILKGTMKPSDAADLLRKLDEPSLNAYMDSTITAALASLHGDPIKSSPSPTETEHGQQAWLNALGRGRFSADVDVLQSTGVQSSDDDCAAGRELWDSAVNLPEPDRSTVVLLLFQSP